MNFYRLIATTIVVPATILTLSACSSSDDDSTDSPTIAALLDEAITGDVSSDANNPLRLQLADGDNQIRASVINTDIDYIMVNVPAGSQLSSIILDEFASVTPTSFIAVQAGTVFTVAPADAEANVPSLLGYAHFGTDMLGNDILADIGSGEGAQGFSGVLAAGDYTFWIQETSMESLSLLSTCN